MLAAARSVLADRPAQLHRQRLEDPLPDGPYDLVASALTVHHLEAEAKADLFVRVAAALGPTGRFVLADVVVPENPADVVTPIDNDYDHPSSVTAQLAWMAAAGLHAGVAWQRQDLAVLIGEPAA